MKVADERIVAALGLEPEPLGSFTQYGGHVVPSNNRDLRAWQKFLAWHIKAATRDARPIDGPCQVRALFYLPRPAGHFDDDGEVLPDARPAPAVKRRNDLDKLLRGSLDPLSGLLYDDDARVVRIVAEKRYSDEPGLDSCGVVFGVGRIAR